MQNIKDLVKSMCEAVKGVMQSQADGKITKGDLVNFVGFAKSLPAAIKDIGQIRDEWEARTVESMEELKAFVAAEFALDADSVLLEEWIENVIGILLDAADAVDAGVDLFKPKG
jgi:hypothetical protein